MTSILEQRSGDERRKGGKPFMRDGEWIRWGASLILAALVAYATVQAQIASIEATAEARHQELIRFMGRVEQYMQRETR